MTSSNIFRCASSGTARSRERSVSHTTRVKATPAKTSSHKEKGNASQKSWMRLPIPRNGEGAHEEAAFLLLVRFGPSVVAAPTGSAQRLELPAGPDRDLVSRACQACHELSMVIAATGLRPPGRARREQCRSGDWMSINPCFEPGRSLPRCNGMLGRSGCFPSLLDRQRTACQRTG
jgi:hypothetical protein